ncbi:hypothetical protein HHK36_008083 [Tetracentron sinense]|uniref:PUM-HD domain-containing protein n=1 Tax=Tetracentron sinense TaxID=13715 RepID=A0A835DJK8_TETSI|nr:hypothetical protein HHK36_008083 [Tetracentron sinense]
MKEDEEFDMLLNEIPHVTSLNHPHHHHHHHHHLHQHNHQVHVHGGHVLGGHGSSPTQTIHGVCENDPSYYYKHMCVSPVSGVSLQSEGSSWSWLSGGLSSSDDGSPSPSPFEGTRFQTPIRNPHHPNGLRFESKFPDSPVSKNTDENFMDELGLSGYLGRMHIRDEQEDSSMIRRFPVDSNGFRFGDRSFVETDYSNVEKHGPFEGFKNDFYDYGGLQSSVRRNPTSLNGENRLALLGLQPECKVGNLLGSCIPTSQSAALFSHPMSSPWEQRNEHASYYYNRGMQVPNVTPYISRPSTSDAFLYSKQSGMDSNGGTGVLNSPSSPQLAHLKLPMSEENVLHYSLPMLNRRTGEPLNNRFLQPLPSMRSTQDFEAFSCEDSLIIQGKGFNYAINKGCDRSRGHKKGSHHEIGMGNSRENRSELDGRAQSGGICGNNQSPRTSCPLLLLPKYNSLMEVQGYIYYIAKDQHGCRFLQRKFEEGNPQEVKLIFNEIIDHVVELMMNPFGNYLMQKLLDVCNEEQRMQILIMVTEKPGELVRISLNTHGTRVVQKLVENLKTRQQILLVISALEPGFLDLIKDPNGNHVVQRCLQCLSNEDNKIPDLARAEDWNTTLGRQFIFASAAKFCVDIATHKHGCCVLQRCIAHSTGKHRENLVAEISANAFLLAQDAFGVGNALQITVVDQKHYEQANKIDVSGLVRFQKWERVDAMVSVPLIPIHLKNYVIQYILGLEIPSVTTNLLSQFEGNYVQLSTQKFSSNVVEKCLQILDEDNRSKIIRELLSTPRFEQLLEDAFANYVIQSALKVAKGPLHSSLVEAIRPHAAILRTNLYCKRIFSRSLLKK